MADFDLAKERAKFLGVFPNAHWTDGATCPDQTWAINTWQGWLAARRQHGSAESVELQTLRAHRDASGLSDGQLWDIAYSEGQKSVHGSAAQALEPKRRDIFTICDAYESGIGHGLQRDGHKSGAIFGNPECGMAYEIGYEEGEERSSGKKPAAPPVAAEQPAAEQAKAAHVGWRNEKDGRPAAAGNTLTDEQIADGKRIITELLALESAKKPGGGVCGQTIGCESWVIRTSGFGLECLHEAAHFINSTIEQRLRAAPQAAQGEGLTESRASDGIGIPQAMPGFPEQGLHARNRD